MTVLILLEKLYGPREPDAKRAFEKTITSFTSELDAKVTFINTNRRNWIQVEVSGSDTKVVTNYLRKKFGLAPSLTDICVPMILKGKIVDSGKFGYGLYVDVGVSIASPNDVLVPLHRLRSHLTDGKKLSLREIRDNFCLYDNFPLLIRLTSIDIEEKKMWAEPFDGQIKLFREWLSTGLDRVIVLGAHREQIRVALKKSGIRSYIAEINELGFLEHALTCKHRTDAPGVITALGRYLRKVPLYSFSPRKVKTILGELPPLIK